jgi:hypothetical protein
VSHARLLFIPWSKPQSEADDRYLIIVGAIIIGVAALIGFALEFSYSASMTDDDLPIPKTVVVAFTMLFDPILSLYLAAAIYLEYRAAAVIKALGLLFLAFGVLFIASPRPSLGDPDPLGALALIADCLGASAALRGTFGLARLRKSDGWLAHEPAAGPPSQHPELRIVALKAAAIFVCVIGAGTAIATLTLLAQLIGSTIGPPPRSGTIPPPVFDGISPNTKFGMYLVIGVLLVLFALAFQPFMAVARKLWRDAEAAKQQLALARFQRQRADATTAAISQDDSTA